MPCPRHLAHENPRAACGVFGAAGAVRHRPRRRTRRADSAHHRRFRQGSRHGDHRHPDHRRFDAQNLRIGDRRCAGRFRGAARPSVGIRAAVARGAAFAALCLHRRWGRHGAGLSAGEVAARTRCRSRRHHRGQEQGDADLCRRNARRGQEPAHRYGRRFRRVQGACDAAA